MVASARNLNFRDFAQTTDSTADSGGSGGVQHPGTSSLSLSTTLAVPDTDSSSLDAILTAEGAGVAGVLGDFHLLDLLTQRGTIAGSVLAGDSNLLRSFHLFVENEQCC